MEEKTGQLVSAGAFQFCQLPSRSHGLRRLGAVNDVLHLVGRFGDELSGGNFGRSCCFAAICAMPGDPLMSAGSKTGHTSSSLIRNLPTTPACAETLHRAAGAPRWS
jgi:hypothetical protein